MSLFKVLKLEKIILLISNFSIFSLNFVCVCEFWQKFRKNALRTRVYSQKPTISAWALNGEIKCIEGMVLSACSFGGILGINPGFVCKRLR